MPFIFTPPPPHLPLPSTAFPTHSPALCGRDKHFIEIFDAIFKLLHIISNLLSTAPPRSIQFDYEYFYSEDYAFLSPKKTFHDEGKKYSNEIMNGK
jgi:hypothetical protein